MILPDRIIERIADPAERRRHMTVTDAQAKYARNAERREQNTLVKWLSLHEEDGTLCYDWSRTDRKTTNRKGIPDFRIYRNGRALLGEMKMEGARLSPDQIEMIEKFERSGTKVQIWESAAAGIRAIKEWLERARIE